MSSILDVISWVLLLSGGAFVFVGGVGALRMPDVYTRIHAASVTDTLGTIFVLLGIILQAGWSMATIKLAAILVFLLLTTPTAAYALANAARLAGIVPERRVGRKEGAS